jgi:hypothetical protein
MCPYHIFEILLFLGCFITHKKVIGETWHGKLTTVFFRFVMINVWMIVGTIGLLLLASLFQH